MSLPSNIRATDPAILAYHATLQQYADHGASHEGATETAFSHLLAVTAKPHGWTLIPKKAMKVGAKTIYPDGTLQDGNFLRRGYGKRRTQTMTSKARFANQVNRISSILIDCDQ